MPAYVLVTTNGAEFTPQDSDRIRAEARTAGVGYSIIAVKVDPNSRVDVNGDGSDLLIDLPTTSQFRKNAESVARRISNAFPAALVNGTNINGDDVTVINGQLLV